MCVEDGDDGSSYRGDVAVTESGRVCQRWDSQLPNGHVHKKVALEIDFSLPKMCVAF